MAEKLTARMKWIVKQLKEHPGAVITHRRDWFWEKSYYSLDWEDDNGFHSYAVTNTMRKQLADAGLIAIVEERPVYSKGGEFRTTERDWGLPPANNASSGLLVCTCGLSEHYKTIHLQSCPLSSRSR